METKIRAESIATFGHRDARKEGFLHLAGVLQSPVVDVNTAAKRRE